MATPAAVAHTSWTCNLGWQLKATAATGSSVGAETYKSIYMDGAIRFRQESTHTTSPTFYASHYSTNSCGSML